MTERERLAGIIDNYKFNCIRCYSCDILDSDCAKRDSEALTDYLLANGVIVLPPCKVGDTIYTIRGDSIREYEVAYFDIFKNKVSYVFKVHLISDRWSDFVYGHDFGKIAFPSRKEAEKALKEREENA